MSTTLSRSEVERGQAGAGMHGELKCEDFVFFIWMGSGVVTVPDVTAEQCPVHWGRVGRQVFRWGSWGPHWDLSCWPQWSPQDPPHLTAGGRVEWQHLGDSTRRRFWKIFWRLQVTKWVKGSYEVNYFQISIGTWLQSLVTDEEPEFRWHQWDSRTGSRRTQLRKSETRPKAWPWEAGEDSLSCPALLSLFRSGLSPITVVHWHKSYVEVTLVIKIKKVHTSISWMS